MPIPSPDAAADHFRAALLVQLVQRASPNGDALPSKLPGFAAPNGRPLTPADANVAS
jgi:hypothetical protein